MVRIWCMQSGNWLQRVCCRAHTLPLLPVEQLEWRWLEKESKRTVRMMRCAQMLTSVTNVRCRDRDRAACDFCMRSACEIDRSHNRRDGRPANVLMGCMYYCELIVAEITCTASSWNGSAHQSDLQCWNFELGNHQKLRIVTG